MTRDDLEIVLEWRNHEDIRRFMYTQHEITLAEHTRWFERAILDSKRHLLVFEINGTATGFVNIHEIAPGGIADWGFYAAPNAPKGTGQLLGKAAIDHAFNHLKLHKICGQAIGYNERSIKFHLNLGFKQEGTLLEHHFDGEHYHNIKCFGLLSSNRLMIN